MTKKPKLNRQSVLVIEDSRAITEGICAFLSDELDIQYETAEDFKTAEQLLARRPLRFFMAIVDLHLPDASPHEVVDHVIARGVPPLILTADYCPKTKNQMLEKAVIDYVIKRNMSELWYVACVVERVRTNTSRKVLIVDDSPSCRLVLSAHLKRQRLQVLEACDGFEALEVLKKHPDTLLVITDQHMPGMLGTELVTKIRSHFSRKQMGVIGMSSLDDRQVIAQLLKSGANDFFLKPYSYEELFCRVAQNIDSMVNHQKLSDAAIRDPLTGLYRRKYLMDISGMVCGQATRSKSIMITMLIEIADFDELIVAHGSEFYENALKHVSRLLLRCLRQTDVVAMFDEDIFCVLCLATSPDSEKQIFKRIEEELVAHPLNAREKSIPLKVRIGHHASNSPVFITCLNNAKAALESHRAGPKDTQQEMNAG